MRNFSEAYPDLDIRAGYDIAAEGSRRYPHGPSREDWRREFPRRVNSRGVRASRPSLLPTIAAAVMVTGATAMIGLRERTARMFPPTAAFYSALGLPVNLPGLELRGLRAKIVADGSRTVLNVEGEIVNLRREANPVPPIALTVRGEDGQDRYAWTTQAPKSKLKEGETIAFRARLASPPADGVDVLARFAGMEETAGAKATTARR